MSILRNSFDQNIVDQEHANFLQEQASAQGMGALRRGWNAGRVGGDLNAALIDEAGALAAGDAQKAALLGQQREHLVQRQALYAPDVAKVEGINGVGDALSWAGTQMGQGAASMADPAALSAAGAALGRLPGPFKLAPVVAGIGSFALNQRQMAGEHVGRLREDPTAMANLGAQGAYDQANMVGLAGGALDTVLPFMAGRALGGAALRQGASGMMGKSFGGKMATGMLGEGATEVGQGEIGRYMHGQANAARDTSGDWSDRLNEFAGGAVGGAPFSAAGAAADMSYGGAAQAGEVVKEKAGAVIDMTAEKAQEAYKATGIKGVVDLGMDGTKSVWESAKEVFNKGKDTLRDAEGNINWAESAERAKQRYDTYKLDAALAAQLDLTDEANLTSDGYARRGDIAYEKLSELADAGDARAEALLDGLSNDDPVVRTNATDEASSYLLEQNSAARLERRTAGLKAAAGSFIQSASGKAVHAVQKAAEGATFVGMNVAAGASKALGKKNLQGVADLATLDYDTWMQWRERAYKGVMDEINRKDAKEEEIRRAFTTSMADTLSSFVMANNAQTARGADPERANDLRFVSRTIGFEIGLLASLQPRRINKGPEFAKQSVAVIDSIVEDLRDLAPDNYEGAVQALMGSAPPEQRPFFDLLVERLNTPPQHQAMSRDQLETQLLQQLDPKHRQELMDVRGGASSLRETITTLVRGQATPAQRAQLEKVLGTQNVRAMVALVAGVEPAPRTARLIDDRAQGAEVVGSDRLSVDDDGEVSTDGELSSFDKDRAERKLEKNVAPPVFGFVNEGAHTMHAPDPNRRDYRNPFSTKDTTGKRPPLARITGDAEADADTSTKLDNRVAALEKQLGVARTPEAYFERALKELQDTFAPVSSSADRANPARADTGHAIAGAAGRLRGALSSQRAVESARLDQLIDGDISREDMERRNERNAGDTKDAVRDFKHIRRQQGAAEGVAAQSVAERAQARRQYDKVLELKKRYQAGDPAAIEQATKAAESFFNTRAGGWDVQKVSAWEVMEDLNLNQGQRLAIFADYMRQEAKRTEDQQAAAKFNNLARLAQSALADISEGTVNEAMRKNSAVNSTHYPNGMPKAELEGATVRDNMPRLSRENVELLSTAMQRYFKQGHIVRAQQRSERAELQMTNAELNTLARKGAAAVHGAIGDRSKVDVKEVADDITADVRSQILNFPQKAGRNFLGGRSDEKANAPLAIKAENLVAWVRMNRKSENSGTDSQGRPLSEEALWLRDLNDGISSILSTDVVSGMPYMVNKFGKKEFFNGTNVPDVLALPYRAGWQRNKTAEKKNAPPSQWAQMTPEEKAAERGRLGGGREGAKANESDDYQEEVGLEALKTDDLSDGGGNNAAAISGDASNEGTLDPYGDILRDYVHATTGKRPEKQEPRKGLSDLERQRRAEETAAIREDAERRNIADGIDREESRYKPDAAEARAAKIFAYKKVTDLTDEESGAPMGKEMKLDFRATAANIQRRIDAATNYEITKKDAEKARAKGAGKYGGMTAIQEASINRQKTVGAPAGERAFAGGKQYLYPLAHALTVKNVGDLVNSGTLSEPQINFLIRKQQETARLIVDSTIPAGVQLQLAKVMGGDETVKTFTDAKKFLEAMAEKPMVKKTTPVEQKAKPMSAAQQRYLAAAAAIDAKTAAPEVAAQAPKSQSKPGGAAKAVNVWHGTDENAHLSNLAARPFTISGKRFHSVEHAYQSWKSGEFDQGTYARYTGAGRKIVGTKGTKTEGGWNLRLMRRLVEESFRQNPDATQRLLATGDAPITHTQDKGVWAKEFPRILMEVRSKLKAGFKLTPTTTHTQKDQLKANRATKFIGRGSERSSTNRYANDAAKAGVPVNAGTYAASDVVFVSAEGNRTGRVAPDLKEIDKAVQAGATILTDNAENRQRAFNVGEREVEQHLLRSGYVERSPGEWGPGTGGRKLSLQGTATGQAPVRQLNKRLVGLLAERGIKIEESALDHVPPEMRVSLVNRTLMADLKEPLAEDVAKFISWMTVGSDMYQKIADGIAGTAFEKAIFSEVNRDARQSMYTPVRKQREVVRRAVERLLTNGLMKKHAAEAPLPLRVVQIVRSAIKGIMEALGGVKYKDLQGLADQYVDDLLSGKITLERPRKPGTVRVDPYEAFKADQHAADLTFALTDGGGFALTGSLAYASQGSVYRPAGAAIHDLDFTTSLTQRAAEQRLERLYPQAHKVRSFGGIGDFVSTYVVPPKGHRADLVVMEGGAVRAFVVRDASGKIVGRYTNNGKGEISTGVKGTVVDLIGDKRGGAGKLTVPTTFGDKQIPIADVAHAMAQKLVYARDKDITDFANFVPNTGRKLNAQGTGEADTNKARTARQKLDELFAAAAEDLGIDPSEVEEAITGGEHQDSWAAQAYRDIINGLDERELVAVFEPDAKAREKLFKALDEVSARSHTETVIPDDNGVEDIDYRDVAAEDAGLLGAEPPDGGQEPPGDAQEGGKSGTGALVVIREGEGTNKAKKRAQRAIPTEEDIQAAQEYLQRVLGDQIRARFGEITGYSGQWIEDENVIEVSTLTLAGALNVARHEALHAFFSKFVRANPQAIKVLSRLTDDQRILRRLQALLQDDPAALAQLQDGEERLAYIYQFAMAGQLKLPHNPGTTLMGKIRKFLRRVFMMVRDDERAVDLLYAFEAGAMRTPDAAAKAIAKITNQGTWARKVARKMDGVVQGTAALVLPANTILANSPSPTARKLAKMLFTNPGEEGAAQDGTGYLNERNQKMRTYNNLFRSTIENLDDRQLRELTEAMQNETPTDQINDPDVVEAKDNLHILLERFHTYLTEEKGLRLGKIRENYFPVVYDPDKVRSDLRPLLTSPKYIGEMNKMVDAINKNIAKGNDFLERQGRPEEARDPVTLDEVLDAIVNHITRDNPSDDIEMEPKRHDGVLRPWFAGGERRVLFFLDPADRAKLQEKDILLTMTRYIRQGVRAAEYSSRFGRDGRNLAHKVMVDGEVTEVGMLPDIKGELYEQSHRMLALGELKDEKARKKWAERQYRDVARAVGAMEGSLGHDVSETVRNINAASIVYQNIRLLPLALFSSFVDPLGIVARGGEMREAWDTFARGIKGVARQWADMLREQPPERAKDEWERLAELAGVVDSATFSHLLTDEYGSVYMGSKASKINEMMFKTNGMEAWNRAMRVGATKSAVAFIERHNKGKDKHSARWMEDLGLAPGTLKLDEDGRLIYDKRVLLAAYPDMEMSEAEAYIGKVHAAINRWVESAILSPNAAQRPAWGSDPHFGMFWHLKQFAYSFHETIMKRAIGEAGHGNYAPLGVFAWYVPAMIAADVTKGLMLGAGELPGYMKNYDLGDWVMHGVKRAGILGIGDIGIEATKDVTSLAGPTVEQATDFFFKPLEDNLIKALPANALYSRAIL